MDKAIQTLTIMNAIAEKLSKEQTRVMHEAFAAGMGATEIFADPTKLKEAGVQDAIEMTKALGKMDAYREELAFISEMTDDFEKLLHTIAGDIAEES